MKPSALSLSLALLTPLSLALPQAAPATNPYNTTCPVPPYITISNFTSTILTGGGGSISFLASYGRGTFTCPNFPSHGVNYRNQINVICDNNDLAAVASDGHSWISIEERFWCTDVPEHDTDAQSTLAATANFGELAGIIDCETDNKGIKTCKQNTTTYNIPIQTFGTGRLVGFSPEDINGSIVYSCPSITGVNPILKDVETCEHYGLGAP